jgi:hypothetical protein
MWVSSRNYLHSLSGKRVRAVYSLTERMAKRVYRPAVLAPSHLDSMGSWSIAWWALES